MSIQLRQLYEETKHRYELKNIAGSGGLSNIMYWLYITEDPENISFFRNGELVITTGVLIKQNIDSLLLFIKTLREKQICGLIINTGKHIYEEQIPDEVITYCNKYHFPLFTMPWHIHIYDISKDYYNRIFYDMNRDKNLSYALLSVCHKVAKPSEYTSLFEQHGFSISGNYRCAIISIAKPDGDIFDIKTTPDFTYYVTLLRASLIRTNSIGHLFLDGYQIVIVSRVSDINDFLKLLNDIEKKLSSCFEKYSYNIGISNMCENISGLSEIFDHALFALKFATETKKPQTSYDNLGALKFMYEIKNIAAINSYVDSKLSKILEYDKLHNTYLTETLKSYIFNHGNITDISSECFCHRNTVANRIEFITNELGINLKDKQERFELSLAFFLKEHTFMLSQ